MTDSSSKKVRITLTLKEKDIMKIDEASKKRGIPKTYYIILAALEKIDREENKDRELKQDK